jgi:glycine/D-amino acid oxidase-like deaminating enzyme
MHNKHIVIIGNGIAAKCVVFELNKIGIINITVIASESHAPMCSTKTTAINCLRGAKRGKSELGELIIDSFEDFIDFYSTETPSGISKTHEMHTTPVESTELNSKWNRRYSEYDRSNKFSIFNASLKSDLFYVENEAYIISPEIYFNWFDSKNRFNLINDSVVEIDENKVITKNGDVYIADELVICTSYMSRDFSNLVTDQKLKHRLNHSKPVSGSYLKFNISDFNPSQLNLKRTYCFRIDEVHLIIRPDLKDVLIGATSSNNSIDISGDKEGMLEQYNKLSHYLETVVDLPSFDKAELITGIRHKGQMRMPYWGQIAEQKYAIWGLYKNAFTFSFSAAKKIASLIQK